MLKPRLRAYFEEYADGHRHPTNRLTHKIAIPLIVFHIIAMLTWVRLFQVGEVTVTLAYPAYVGAILWYATLNLRLAAIMAVLYAICFPLAWATPWQVVVAIAIVGWGIQLAGHLVWEKKSPAFLTNLLQALIGPLFFVAVLTHEWPERPTPAISR